MPHDVFRLNTTDDCSLHVHRWHGAAPPRAVLMVAHGLAEHGGRYGRFAEALLAAGIEVYAHDQRGHGLSSEPALLGHFADEDGWDKLVRDLAALNHHIRQQHPGAPIFLFAHSMGSYVAQSYLMRHSCSLQGAILSGSNYQPLALYRSAELVARFERWRQGPRGRSALIEWLSFGAFNKAFKPARTRFDWLSRDATEVDRYIADPLCGFRCSNQLWLDLLGGLQQITPVEHLAQIDSQLPLLIIGGNRDPVSQGHRLDDLADALRTAGMQDITLRLYADARHELLNETNREEITADLLCWLQQRLERSSPCLSDHKENE